jgi:hypothetical protein
VPRARHGRAAVLGSQAPRACVHAPDRTQAELLAQPRHTHATATPCAATPRRDRDVAFASRPGHRGISPSTFRALSHTHPHARTHTFCRTGSGPPHRIPQRLTGGTKLSEEKRERRRRPARGGRRRGGPARRKEREKRRPSPWKKESRPAEGAEPRQAEPSFALA